MKEVVLLLKKEDPEGVMILMLIPDTTDTVTEASTLPTPEPEAGVDHIPTKVRMMSLMQTESSDFATPPVQGNGRPVLL